MPAADEQVTNGMATHKILDGLSINGIQIGGFLNHALDKPSYPTNCLNFLKAPQPPKFRFVVVGAGIGGLCAAIALARLGHSVRILEQASALGEVGAGIQIPANSSRILLDWGLGEYLQGRTVEPEDITFRRWQSGDAIGYTSLISEFRETYQAPYYVVHRAHFHDALHKLALRLGVEISVNTTVVTYNEDEPSVSLAGGSKVKADFVIAADGIKSLARNSIPSEANRPPFNTGFAAYRATVDVEQLRQDSELAFLLEKPSLHVWIGEDRHVMAYTIAGGKSLNLVLSHVDRTDPSTWTPATAVADMRTYFDGWDPRLLKIIKKIDKTLKWPLMAIPPLQKWLTPSGKMIVIGDAAHAMLPYMSQGAAIAVEDAAALAEAFRHAHDAEDIPRVLSVFQRVRSKRASQMVQASFINGKLWHFADGAEQRARDAAMRPEVLGEKFAESPNQWSDPVTQHWAYGYDAVEAIARELLE